MYNSEVKGKGCIVARVVADSVSESGKRITTMEVEFPRFILSEYNTHRAFSRNAASSRAISILQQLAMIAESPAMPIFYGEDQKGMSAENELSAEKQALAESIILEMRDFCINKVQQLKEECNLHKQTANRYIEPWQVVKGVVTATEWNNFFHLRDHKDAQPEIAELARCMKAAMDESDPELLTAGEWHIPYVDKAYTEDTGQWDYYVYANDKHVLLTTDEALKVSASCCAQVSYRLLDQSIDKALMIYDQLVNSKPVHASPFEHQGTPMKRLNDFLEDECSGITHEDRDFNLWSGNFCQWIQYRQLIKDNVVHG